jgi:hypothetical protein
MAPTPCSEYDVQALVNYIVGWSQLFAAAANGMGEGKTFGSIIGVADDAPGLDRVLGFMGRQPCPPVTG